MANKKGKVSLEKFDKYMKEKGFIDWASGPTRLGGLSKDLEFLLGDSIINNKEKREKIILYLEKRNNKDMRGPYYARVYIPY